MISASQDRWDSVGEIDECGTVVWELESDGAACKSAKLSLKGD